MKKDKIRGRRQGTKSKKTSKLDKWITQTVKGGSDDPLVIAKKRPRKKAQKRARKGDKLRIIPLGGLEEVGKNSMVFEYKDDIVVVDMGLQFPEEDMLGIDYIIPDVTYLEERRKRVKGIIITHGHLDHIGGLAYVLPRLGFPPVYGTRLTLGLVKKQLEEHGILKQTKLEEITSKSVLKLGAFTAGFFRVNHSIPDGVGIYLKTPVGSVAHTGDFKFDAHPADDKPAEIGKMKALGRKRGLDRVSILFSDSTNALNPGKTKSEKVIGESLDKVIGEAKGRIIIASFSSLIGRIQQILNSAHKHGRVVAVSGRSMENNINIARDLGYLKVPKGTLKPLKQVLKQADDKVLLITTGSQGEAMSALARMAIGDHKHVKIQKNDTVVLSSTPIIGNERAVATVINNLCKLGANIVSNDIMDVHTSGHGCQEDLKQMLRFIRPNKLAPIHGNIYMRTAHGKVGREIGYKEEDVLMFPENGNVIEMNKGNIRLVKEKVPSNYVVVDGLGTGDVGSQVLVDREAMARNGVLVVVFQANKKTRKLKEKPLILTRGFIYMNESDEVIAELKKEAAKAYTTLIGKDPKAKSHDVCNYVKRVLDGVAKRKLDRRPLVVPWVMNV